MLNGVLVLGVLMVGVVIAFSAARRLRHHAMAVSRLNASGLDDSTINAPSRSHSYVRPFTSRYRGIPLIIGVIVSVVLMIAVQPQPSYAIVPGVIVVLIGMEVDRLRVSRLEAKIEEQLSDAIDLMVGALQAGAGATAALDAALRESRWPLQSQLNEVAGRIRLGDDPQAVLRDLTRRVPLENFILFASALSVHWEVGGSLAGTLSTTGRAIRDRIELARRVRSLTSQARMSVGAVLGTTYFIAAMIWRNNPDRMMSFVTTQIGSWLIGVAIILQAGGIVWTSIATRFRY